MRFDLLRDASIVGGERRRPAKIRAWRRALLGLAAGGEKEGRREQVVEGVSFILQGGPGCEGSGGGGRGGARPWRQGFPCRHSDDADRGGPTVRVFPFFLFPEIPEGFRYLIGAFKQC